MLSLLDNAFDPDPIAKVKSKIVFLLNASSKLLDEAQSNFTCKYVI